MDSTTSCKVIPCIGVPMAIDHFFSLISAYLQGWTSQSIAVWRELTGYQLVKASHCKYTNSPSEHEFVIYTLVDEHKNKLELRTDRAVVDHKECKDVSLPSLLVSLFGVDVGRSPLIISSLVIRAVVNPFTAK